MSARSVWSGTRPSRYHSERAISAPPKTAPDHNLDALGSKTKRRLHASLHGSTEGHSFFQLSRDVFTDELGIQFRLLDFLHRDVDLPGVLLFQLRLELVDLSSLTTDDDTGAAVWMITRV